MECYIFPWIVGGRQCYFKIENLEKEEEILRMSKPVENGMPGHTDLDGPKVSKKITASSKLVVD